MVSMREMLIPIGRRRPGTKLDKFRGVVIHNTGNHSDGAGAKNNALYQQSTPNYVTPKGTTSSWHNTVDEKEIVISIPWDEVAYHCGNSRGNKNTVAIEIADNADGDLLKATDNAAWLAAYILRSKGFTKASEEDESLTQHNHWSGKNCPEEIRAGQRPGGRRCRLR